MGLSNTDQFNDQNFRLAAEAYRMKFVQTMNLDMALHSKEDGFTTYKVGKELFSTIPEFTFRPQNVTSSLSNYPIETVCLFLLVTGCWLLAGRIARKL